MPQIEGLTLVTGGTGFLGGRALEMLREQGTPVRALVRRDLPPHLAGLDVDCHRGDLVDARSHAGALDGVDTVIHCAGMVTDYGPYRAFMHANGTGTANLVDAAVRAGVRRFVHISTVDVYGYPPVGQAESSPMRRTGLGYNDSKIAGEHAVRNAGAKHGLRFSIIRPATIYGPRSEPFVVELGQMLLNNEMVFIGNGAQDAGLVYVDNIVDMALAAATHDAAVGETYNGCDCAGVTWRQYCDTLAELVGAKPCRTRVPFGLAYAIGAVLERGALLLRRERRPLLTRMAVNILGLNQCHPNTKAKSELGWEPRVSFAEGMQRIGAWLQEHPVTS